MKDLAQRVARLFSPKPWKHKWKGGECACGANVNFDVPDLRLCTIPDPIDITDLGKALECFRGLEAVPFSIMATAYNRNANRPKSATCLNVMRWLLKHATAEQIWEICCLAKESE